MTLRLPTSLYDELKEIARAEGVTVSSIVRTAIDEYIDRKRNDPAFQRRLREHIEHDMAVLERLRQ